MTVLNSVQEMRIERACRQLQAGQMTCVQIAFECGFGSVQQFNRVFLKLRHCTPLNWQRQFGSAGRDNTAISEEEQPSRPVPSSAQPMA